MRNYFVYILASKKNGTLYAGVTNNLKRRVYDHKNGLIDGFTKKYRIHVLVYAEEFDSIHHAIKREHQIKRLRRFRKIMLIESLNLQWLDLYNTLQ